MKAHYLKKVHHAVGSCRQRLKRSLANITSLLLCSFLLTSGSVATEAKNPIQVISLSPWQKQQLKKKSPLLQQLVTAAEESIGTPYKWGGTDLTKGIDCSNFTWKLFHKINQPYPRYLGTQFMSRIHRHQSLTRIPFKEARAGDLLVYGYSDQKGWHGHVVILIDKDGKASGIKGLTLGAHGGQVRSVQYVTYEGYDTGYFKHPKMRLVSVLRMNQDLNKE